MCSTPSKLTPQSKAHCTQPLTDITWKRISRGCRSPSHPSFPVRLHRSSTLPLHSPPPHPKNPSLQNTYRPSITSGRALGSRLPSRTLEPSGPHGPNRPGYTRQSLTAPLSRGTGGTWYVPDLGWCGSGTTGDSGGTRWAWSTWGTLEGRFCKIIFLAN